MSRIVSAVGVAVSHDGSEGQIQRAKRVEAAMVDAIAKAHIEGIADQDAVRSRMLAARDQAAH